MSIRVILEMRVRTSTTLYRAVDVRQVWWDKTALGANHALLAPARTTIRQAVIHVRGRCILRLVSAWNVCRHSWQAATCYAEATRHVLSRSSVREGLTALQIQRHVPLRHDARNALQVL